MPREEVEMERMDDESGHRTVVPRKKGTTGRLAGLPFHEKVKAVVQKWRPRSCGPEAGTYVCGAFRRWKDEAFQPAAAKWKREIHP